MARRISAVVIDALTAQNAAGTLNDADMAEATEVAFYVVFDHTSAAGVVLIEGAHSTSYTGTWAALATVTWAAIDKVHYVAITGAHKCIRARISSAVTSGTVSVYMVGN